jgi:AbrB family looped-hinge helix DNA binding protein
MGIGNSIGMQITLDRMSRIVVPKAIRDRFALRPGDGLEITIEGDAIRLRPAVAVSPVVEADGMLVCSSEVPQSCWDIGAFLDEQRGARSTEISGL